MKIAVSSDEHTHLVDYLINELKNRGHAILYFGPSADQQPQDWPVVTLDAVNQVIEGNADEAIVMCWTGTGCSIAANKVAGIRAALCADGETAKGARIWNHANVLALSLRATSEPLVEEILDQWFSTAYSEDEWNKLQIDRIIQLDKNKR
ncbi:MAG: RpiB/LacA/LacB family sugar-phosphate isomerase [Saprospiraceae bacterium]|nr:RpiB/LacA/LacB family sugar-phosphate isomerase [Saprospiraceae bacterium]